MDYLQCWITAARALFSQAVAGAPELVEAGAAQCAETGTCFVAELGGALAGRLFVLLDAELLLTPLMGEGVDQKTAWGEILREVAESAVGELLATTGVQALVLSFGQGQVPQGEGLAFALRLGERSYTFLISNSVRPAAQDAPGASPSGEPPRERAIPADAIRAVPAEASGVTPGLELLLDVELEAALRFGCRELLLGELLELGPGDVVELDRHVSDPVDLIVGDKIVAQGEVVLVNGNFGLRVTEVAAPRKRLESIRCLF